jgi:L-threonylcarbamoyladenylate synthase
MRILERTPENVVSAAADIRGGKLVVWPSPVWYGLATNALDPEAVRRVYQAKGRPAGEALLVLTLGAQDAERYGVLNEVARRLIAEFWPGFLGVVVPKRGAVPDHVTAGGNTVLLAQLDDLGHELPALAGVPVVSTSANRSGQPPAIDMEEVRAFARAAGSPIDTAIAGPLSPMNRATTIVDTTVSPPAILRRGVVHERSVQRVLPDVVLQDRSAEREP